MFEILIRFLLETWRIINISSPYILLGFFLAGIIKAFIPPEVISKHLGKSSMGSVLKATLFGIPLPLCSCSVLPTAMGLKKQGSSNSATLAFLISTPETGVDSISMTFAVMDPLMAIFRPMAAFISSMMTGIAAIFFDKEEFDKEETLPMDLNCCKKGNLSKSESSTETKSILKAEKDKTYFAKFSTRSKEVFSYAFRILMDDLSRYLVIGILSAAMITAFIPQNFIESVLGRPFLGMLLMLIIGIPMYVCATGSTPIAAALILKGMSPGAGLVFLLAGPATNLGTIAAVNRFLGRKMVILYLLGISISAIALGYLLNGLYALFNIDPRASMSIASHEMSSWWKVVPSLLLIFLIIRSFHRLDLFRKWFEKLRRSGEYVGLHLNQKRVAISLIILIIILYLGSGFTKVNIDECALVQQFGEVLPQVYNPGLHYCLPYPIAKMIKIKVNYIRSVEIGFKTRPSTKEEPKSLLKPNTSDIGALSPELTTFPDRDVNLEESLILVGDENIVDLRFSTFYKIKDPYQYYVTQADLDTLIKSFSQAALQELISKTPVDENLTTSRHSLEQETTELLQNNLDALKCGVEILSVSLQHVHAPAETHFAFRDLASAIEDKNRLINEAYAYAAMVVAQASGEGSKAISEAEAGKYEKIADSSGQAHRFLDKASAYKLTPILTKKRLYLESLERFLPAVDKYLLPGSDSNLAEDLWLFNQPIANIENLAK